MKLSKKLLAVCFAIIAAIALNIFTPVIASAAKGSVTTKVLNVRSGPGKTFKKVGTLKKGQTVNVVSKKAGWQKVQYKGRTGFVSGKYIRVR